MKRDVTLFVIKNLQEICQKQNSAHRRVNAVSTVCVLACFGRKPYSKTNNLILVQWLYQKISSFGFLLG